MGLFITDYWTSAYESVSMSDGRTHPCSKFCMCDRVHSTRVSKLSSWNWCTIESCIPINLLSSIHTCAFPRQKNWRNFTTSSLHTTHVRMLKYLYVGVQKYTCISPCQLFSLLYYITTLTLSGPIKGKAIHTRTLETCHKPQSRSPGFHT